MSSSPLSRLAVSKHDSATCDAIPANQSPARSGLVCGSLPLRRMEELQPMNNEAPRELVFTVTSENPACLARSTRLDGVNTVR